MFFNSQDIESALKGNFDAVLDTIGVPDTERVGINLLKRGGHYMTLQVGNFSMQLRVSYMDFKMLYPELLPYNHLELSISF